MNADSKKISRWEQFALRLRSEAERTLANNKKSGVAIITVHVLMNADGDPLVWVVPVAKRIEPSKDAAIFIKQFVEEF